MKYMLLNIISFAVVFCILVLFHEFGHFAAAKLNGVYVHEFSIGMGPHIFQKQGKETLYSIRALPIGGYVNMEGEDTESDHPNSFSGKGPFRRLSVLVAGPFMNFLLAILLFFILFIGIGFSTSTIGEVTSGSPAEIAGLEANDKIVEINGYEIKSWDDVLKNISESGETIEISVVKDSGEIYQANVVPVLDEQSGRKIIGIMTKPEKNILKSAYYSVERVGLVTKEIFKFLIKLPFGGASTGDVVGPVGMYKMVGSAAQSGIFDLVVLGAMLSINLGIFNLLPFPALDGGRMLFIFIEILRGKPLAKEAEGKIHFVGLAILMALMVLLIFKDLAR